MGHDGRQRAEAGWRRRLVMGALALALAAPLWAEQSTQTVQVTVPTVSELSIAEDTVTIIIKDTGPGGTGQGSAAATYGVADNTGTRKKLMVLITEAMPDGTALYVTADAPPGATSVGEVQLLPSIYGQDLVRDILRASGGGLTLTFRFTAEAGAGQPDRGTACSLMLMDQ